ncbi:MAG: LytTR family DNA-binding domain-containing protein [Pseudomonadota bacterium]
MSAGIATFVAVFNPGLLLSDMTLQTRLLFSYVNLGLFLLVSYAAIARVLLWAYDRGWPVFFVHVATYVPLAVGNALVLEWLTSGMVTLPGSLWRTAIIVAMITISAALGLALYQAFALPSVRLDLTARKAFWFSKHPASPLMRLLPHHLRAAVVRIEAANQYSIVWTTAGQTMLRLTLKELEAMVPEGKGLRVHRSHWASFDCMAGVRFQNGNPRLLLKNGDVIPVSRAKLRLIKPHLQ